MAPRKRQPYTSKRLQQVVSDYRKRKDDGDPTTFANGTAGDLASEGAPEKGDSQKGGGARKKRPKVRITTASKPRKRQKVVASECETGIEQTAEEITSLSNVPDRPLGVTLRTRKAGRKVVEDEDSEELESSLG
jgi:DNA excision repair protein ERCC-5